MGPLLRVAEARQRLLSHFPVLEGRKATLEQAVGRVLAEAVPAQFDLPAFSNSSMDGFAVRAADVSQASLENPARLHVMLDIPAGQAPHVSIDRGQAARIMTGAPVPEGADAVVPVEDTDAHTRTFGLPLPKEVLIFRSVQPGDSIRPRGQDLSAGEQALPAGLRLRPQDAGFLAMLGVSAVSVVRSPRVALFSTGDELLTPGEPLAPGKIYDSNSITLAALINTAGGEVLKLGIVPDQEEAVEKCLERAVSEGADLILSSAGVSVGAFDFVRVVIERKGRLDFWRVNMRPGKPLAFGEYGGKPFIGLPGNPVSAFVGFEIFVRPALLKLQGLDEDPRPQWNVFLGEPVESDGRESYLRAVVVTVDGREVAHLTGHQGSGNLRSLVQANALIQVPSGVKYLPAGSEVEALPLGDLMKNW